MVEVGAVVCTDPGFSCDIPVLPGDSSTLLPNSKTWKARIIALTDATANQIKL